MTAGYKLHAVEAVIEPDGDIPQPVRRPNRNEAEPARMSEAQVDQLLVERVQKGDKTAGAKLYDWFHECVWYRLPEKVRSQVFVELFSCWFGGA